MVNKDKKEDHYKVGCCETISMEVWNTLVFELFYSIT